MNFKNASELLLAAFVKYKAEQAEGKPSGQKVSP